MTEKDFKEIINKFKTSKDQSGNHLKIDYVSIKHKDNLYTYSFNKEVNKSDVRSLSKTVLTLVASIVMDQASEGILSPFNYETFIYPIIKDKVTITNKENIDKLQKVQVKHLLSHTIGFDKKLLMRNDIKEIDPYTYLNYLVNQPLKYEAGSYYLYSNAGFYLLSTVLEIFLETNLIDFIDKYLFSPLEIKDYHWEKYGDYLAGATRLWLYPQALINIGEMLMNNGCYKNKKIISKEKIDKMLQLTTKTENVDYPSAIFRRYAYASGIWLAKDNIFFGHGTDGQTLLVIPDKKAIIVTLARQNDVAQLENIINDIIINYL